MRLRAATTLAWTETEKRALPARLDTVLTDLT
jgi:hypothetical protein